MGVAAAPVHSSTALAWLLPCMHARAGCARMRGSRDVRARARAGHAGLAGTYMAAGM